MRLESLLEEKVSAVKSVSISAMVIIDCESQ